MNCISIYHNASNTLRSVRSALSCLRKLTKTRFGNFSFFKKNKKNLTMNTIMAKTSASMPPHPSLPNLANCLPPHPPFPLPHPMHQIPLKVQLHRGLEGSWKQTSNCEYNSLKIMNLPFDWLQPLEMSCRCDSMCISSACRHIRFGRT